MRFPRIGAQTIVIMMVLFPSDGFINAQETQIIIVHQRPDSSFVFEIENTRMFAFTREQVDTFLSFNEEIERLTQHLALSDSLIEHHYKPTLEQADDNIETLLEEISSHRTLAASLEKTIKDQAALIKELEGKGLSLQAGLGITGSNRTLSGALGVEINRWRFLGILQQRNNGILVGYNFWRF